MTMSTAEKKPILYSDLEYWINKLIYHDGKENVLKAGIEVLPSSRDSGIFYMLLPTSAGRNFSVRVTKICYQARHRPTRTVSPIYDHDFSEDPVTQANNLCYIGPMKLYPAENVWPELTRQGWYGELPQFFT